MRVRPRRAAGSIARRPAPVLGETVTRQILLTGASGYIGGRLLPVLLARGHAVRCLARAPERLVLPPGAEAVRGDAATGAGLEAALAGADTAYYLIHSMGRGSDAGSFAARDRQAARTFGDAARRAGVRRVVYLGGLGATGAGASAHLRSRHEVAELLGERADEFVYARAATVVGAGSASFLMLDALVRRLPAMICPRWIGTRSQPIAIGDVVAALAAAAEQRDAPGEVQLGGADVLTYRAMMRRYAAVIGRRPPLVVPVPVLTPRLSSYWVSLVTPVERGLVEPLVDGLSAEMVVDTPPPPGLNDAPLGFEPAARLALAEAGRS